MVPRTILVHRRQSDWAMHEIGRVLFRETFDEIQRTRLSLVLRVVSPHRGVEKAWLGFSLVRIPRKVAVATDLRGDMLG